MEHKALLIYLLQNIIAHKGEGHILLEHSQDLSCTTSPRRTGDVCGDTQHTKEQNELNARERKGQDDTKRTSASAESCIQFLWSVMPISMTALTWMVKNIINRNTIEDFTEETDEAGFVGQCHFFHLLMRMLCLCLAPLNLLLSVAHPSSGFVIMAVSIPHCVVKSDSLSLDDDRLREDDYHEAPAFSRPTISLEFDEETMKPEKAAEAPRNAGIDPSTMKMKQWYRGHDRVSDQKAPTGTDRASCHARRPFEDDDERRAMREGDMPPPVPERVKTTPHKTIFAV